MLGQILKANPTEGGDFSAKIPIASIRTLSMMAYGPQLMARSLTVEK